MIVKPLRHALVHHGIHRGDLALWCVETVRSPAQPVTNTVRQLDGLSFDKMFTDKISGGNAERPQPTALLSHAREGDTVVVHSMDRLARNLDGLRALVNGLTEKGVRVEFIKEGLTFTGEDSAMSRLLLSVMGAFDSSWP